MASRSIKLSKPDLSTIKFILVLVMIALVPFSESIKTISMYLAFAVMLAQFYSKEIKLSLTPMHWGFLLLIVSVLACSLFADNPAKSLRGIRDILLYSTVFFVASSISNEKHARAILWAFYISTTAAALIGVAYVIQSGGRVEISQLRNPNYIAVYMVIALTSMCSTIIFSDRETWRSKVLLGGMGLLVLTAAILAVFRAPFLGFALFIFALLYAGGKRRKLLLYAAALICILLFASFLYSPMWSKLITTKSLVARLYLWEYAFDVFKEHPLVGAGIDHFKCYIPPGVPDAGKTYYDAHSLYMNVAAQMGLLALTSLVFIIVGFFHEFISAKKLSGFGESLKYGALGGFLVTFSGGLFDTTLHHGHAVAFALLMGLFVAHRSQTEDKLAVHDKTGEGDLIS